MPHAYARSPNRWCASKTATAAAGGSDVLNIVFLVVAAILAVRFLRTGGAAMLRMMNAPDGGTEGGMEHSGRGHG
jgi:hypothetical protein